MTASLCFTTALVRKRCLPSVERIPLACPLAERSVLPAPATCSIDIFPSLFHMSCFLLVRWTQVATRFPASRFTNNPCPAQSTVASAFRTTTETRQHSREMHLLRVHPLSCPCTARSTSPFPWLSATKAVFPPVHAILTHHAFNDLSWSLFKITFRYPRRSKSFNTTAKGFSTPFSGTWCDHLHFERLLPAQASQCHVLLGCFLDQNLLRGKIFDALVRL